MKKMLLEQIRTAFDAGGLTAAQVVATGQRFHVVADTKAGGRVVLVRHSDSSPRFFSDPGTAIKMLRDVGFSVVTVNVADWKPEQGTLSHC